jgi:hypothetical protein
MDRTLATNEIVGPGNGYNACQWPNTNVNSAKYPTCAQHFAVGWDSIFVRVKLPCVSWCQTGVLHTATCFACLKCLSLSLLLDLRRQVTTIAAAFARPTGLAPIGGEHLCFKGRV